MELFIFKVQILGNRRGATLPEKSFFDQRPKGSKTELTDPKTGYKRTTRDVLVVSGYLNEHRISLLINHWPSRRGGKTKVLESHESRPSPSKNNDSLTRKFQRRKNHKYGRL